MEKKKVIKVKVFPNSKEESISTETNIDGIDLLIKFNVTPEKNKANIKVIKLLSDYFKCDHNSIKIISGLTSRIKIISLN